MKDLIKIIIELIVRKNTRNYVTELEMVNSASVKQAYLLNALPICIDKLHGYTDLYVYKLDFTGDLTWLKLMNFLR